MSFFFLLIEDSEDDAIITNRLFIKKGTDIELDVRRTMREVRAYKAPRPIDLILCDLNLGDYYGAETLREVKRLFPTIPIVILSGNITESMGIWLSQEGAEDVLDKGLINMKDGLLLRTCLQAISRFERSKRDRDLLFECEQTLRRERERAESLERQVEALTPNKPTDSS